MVWHAGVITEREISKGSVESHPPPLCPFYIPKAGSPRPRRPWWKGYGSPRGIDRIRTAAITKAMVQAWPWRAWRPAPADCIDLIASLRQCNRTSSWRHSNMYRWSDLVRLMAWSEGPCGKHSRNKPAPTSSSSTYQYTMFSSKPRKTTVGKDNLLQCSSQISSSCGPMIVKRVGSEDASSHGLGAVAVRTSGTGL